MLINILGGSGFIGTCLTKRLLNNNINKVNIIDKVQSSFFPEITYIADVTKIETIDPLIIKDSIIINLAAEHRDNVSPLSLYEEVNVLGAKNICDVANKNGISKIVFTSSVAVYGFAPIGTNENGKINPFNEYGRTKFLAEEIFKAWQLEESSTRSVVIVRPTVVFGERNRGNVYNLFKQISSRKFMMIGDGENRKSMAYVENLAAFLEYALDFGPGVHIYNYIDKPDFTMNALVSHVSSIMGRPEKVELRIPYIVGLLIGKFFDLASFILNKKYPISSIRVKKFCANSIYESSVSTTGFNSPVNLISAIEKTVRYEFIESKNCDKVFYSE
jgi:nucleoside-diphosphate-sugar epimerase